MNLTFQKSPLASVKADAAVAFLHEDSGLLKQGMRALNGQFKNSLTPIIESGDFKGKEKEVAVLYPGNGFKSKRLVLVGLGEKKKLTLEKFRRAAATGAKRAQSLKARSIAIELPSVTTDKENSFLSFAEGAFLSLYRYDKFLTKKKEDAPKADSLIFCTTDVSLSRISAKVLEKAQILCEATCFARDLENAPANEIYPETLAKAAKDSADKFGFSAKILDEFEIKELGMGGVVGVSQGSARPPRFIVLEYGRESKKPVVLVGKGVTFDTGGISIKPSAGMAEMKMDMSGAAAVIGTFEAVARLNMPVRIVGLIPAVENMPSGS